VTRIHPVVHVGTCNEAEKPQFMLKLNTHQALFT